MRGSCMAVLLIVSTLPSLAQAPVVSTVVNAASNILPGLPNAGIAQGSLMILYGTGLGPPSLVSVPAYPLPTSLSGTSVRISVGGRTIDALLYYTSANQVAAIVPSNTPVGVGTVTVTFNERISAASQIAIVSNNLGLYTVNSAGTGTAVVTFADYSYVSPSNAVNPGETVILWANGLGPIATDDAQTTMGGDMTNVPLEILIGGKAAAILYRGRNSCCASLDQINVRIPDGVAGCITPIVARIGGLVSNTASIPIAARGRSCTTNDPATTDSEFQTLAAKSPAVMAQVALLRTTVAQAGAGESITTSVGDAGSAFFYRYTPPFPYAVGSLVDVPPPGSCGMTLSASTSGLTAATTVFIDAGTAITVSGTNGVRQFTKNGGAGAPAYGGSLGTGVPGNYLDAGAYTISGPGGADVGRFSTTIQFPRPLLWTNQANITSVNLANGQTVSWTGGDPNGLVQISGQTTAATSATSSVFARFDCVARVSDGTFTIPAAVLLGLPPTTSALGTLTVGSTYTRAPFSAPGLDHGYVYFGTNNLNLGIVAYR